MTMRDLLEWIPTIISTLAAIGIFVSRTWLQSTIERSVQHTFDQKIENVRTDLRLSEERVKSEIRLKEAEISALRDGVLSGRGQRQALLDRRRLDAVERIWTRVSTGLTAYKAIASMASILDSDTTTKRSLNEPNIRKAVELMISHIPEDDATKSNMSAERIFVSPLAWAHFSAYQLILYMAYHRAKLWTLGISDPTKLLNLGALRAALRAALPHQSEYIDGQPISSYDYLLDELEECILKELRSILKGREYDQAEIARAGEIMAEVNRMQASIDRGSANPGVST